MTRLRYTLPRSGNPHHILHPQSPTSFDLDDNLLVTCDWIGCDLVYAPGSFDATYRQLPSRNVAVDGIAPLSQDQPTSMA